MKIEKIDKNKYIINKTGDMKVPVILYCNDEILNNISSDQSINQIINVSEIPGIMGNVVAMPDIHQGFGFPIGTVAAFDAKEGVVSPGGVGFDINCGIRLIKTNLLKNEIEKIIEKLSFQLFNYIPSGIGSQGLLKFGKDEVKKISEQGLLWLRNNGYSFDFDIENIEDNGCISQADSKILSEESLNRGKTELGTIGSGNHFLEIGYISEIYDKNVAKEFGLFLNQIVIWIHTGSRGFGHQIAKEYIQKMRQKMQKNGLNLKDPDLVYLPLKDDLSQNYLTAMKCAANYAYCNRQIITFYVRKVFESIFKKSFESLGIYILYDVCHNIAKFESHLINGKNNNVLVHRKGATRSFPAKRHELPAKFFNIGQPVLVPGDMKRGSFILVGTNESMNNSFGSVSHGAGRIMSRNQAKRNFNFSDIKNDLARQNIILLSNDNSLVQEEAPMAYKDITSVIEVLKNNNLAKIVAKSLPISVIKG